MANKIVLDDEKLRKLMQIEPQLVSQWLDGFSEGMVTDIKLSMNTSPAGQTYTRGGVSHTASQPGYPPNIDIGNLIGTIRWEPQSTFTRKIIAGTDYAVPLEFGTERIAPRPFMTPAFDRAGRTIEDDARRNLHLEDL